DPAKLQSALRSVANNLINRDPTANEMQTASQGFLQYQSIVNSYLNSAEFQTAQISYYKSYFNIANGASGPSGGVDYDEPANMATYLVVNDHDFRKSLTATYCIHNVNGTLTEVACSSFPTPADAANQAAGILTTQAFLIKSNGGFNFHRVKQAFEA